MNKENDINTNEKTKEDDTMNAYAIRSTLPFITSKPLVRTPASELNKEIATFIESHEFSFNINKKTEDLEISIKDKRE